MFKMKTKRLQGPCGFQAVRGPRSHPEEVPLCWGSPEQSRVESTCIFLVSSLLPRAPANPSPMPETQLQVQEKRLDLPVPVAPAWDSGLEAIERSPGGSDGKESACNVEDLGLIPGSGKSPGEGNGSPLQSSCLEISMDRGTWWATVHGVIKSQTRLSNFHFTSLPGLGPSYEGTENGSKVA